MKFSSPDDFIAVDNPFRIIDAFAEKPDPIAIVLQRSGIEQHSDTKRKTNPGGAPSFDDKLLLKVCLYSFALMRVPLDAGIRVCLTVENKFDIGKNIWRRRSRVSGIAFKRNMIDNMILL